MNKGSEMIIVTGGAGFIGSQLVRGLNRRYPDTDILVVDDLQQGIKFTNLCGSQICDYLDKDDFLLQIEQKTAFPKLKAIFHQGACSVTTEWDGRYMMKTNYEYSKRLLQVALQRRVPFIYASSAAVYGTGTLFVEDPRNEKPINMYAYSKYLFDQFVRRVLPAAKSPIVGLRYFNVYGPGEAHKGSMASVVCHASQQLQEKGTITLFAGCGTYPDGEQRRDFVYVEDVVDVNLWCLESQKSGIYNVGTGQSETFNQLANAVIRFYGHGSIRYIPFPESLKKSYQSFTQADLSQLRQAGYEGTFRSIEQGVQAYLTIMHKHMTN